MGGLIADVTPTAQAVFSSDQITTISNAINTAITNVLNMFVSLVPLYAVIAGVAFGIKLVQRRFNKTGGSKVR